MKILFDLLSTQKFAHVKYNGGAEYTKVIFDGLLKVAGKNGIVCVYSSEMALDPDVEHLCTESGITLYDLKKTGLNEIVKKEKIGVFFIGIVQRYAGFMLSTLECPIIAVWHDVSDLIMFEMSFSFPDFGSMSILKKVRYSIALLMGRKNPERLIRQPLSFYNNIVDAAVAGKLTIITDSLHTKYSIASYFPQISKNSIQVYYPPEKKNILNQSNVSSVVDDIISHKKFFLMISCNRKEKNPAALIKAFDGYGKDWDGHVCVMVGRLDKELSDKIVNKERFINLEDLTAHELDMLYSKAAALVYPSFSEGYGYPPIEAMKYGTPVICSAVTSICEIVGDAGLYFNPYNPRELEARLRQFLDTDRKIMAGKSLAQYKHISGIQERTLDTMINLITGRKF